MASVEDENSRVEVELKEVYKKILLDAFVSYDSKETDKIKS
jgi:hypothetical protein